MLGPTVATAVATALLACSAPQLAACALCALGRAARASAQSLLIGGPIVASATASAAAMRQSTGHARMVAAAATSSTATRPWPCAQRTGRTEAVCAPQACSQWSRAATAADGVDSGA
eukprot:5115434-Pleurochrysis_carterae.AAC.2